MQHAPNKGSPPYALIGGLVVLGLVSLLPFARTAGSAPQFPTHPNHQSRATSTPQGLSKKTTPRELDAGHTPSREPPASERPRSTPPTKSLMPGGQRPVSPLNHPAGPGEA